MKIALYVLALVAILAVRSASAIEEVSLPSQELVMQVRAILAKQQEALNEERAMSEYWREKYQRLQECIVAATSEGLPVMPCIPKYTGV